LPLYFNRCGLVGDTDHGSAETLQQLFARVQCSQNRNTLLGIITLFHLLFRGRPLSDFGDTALLHKSTSHPHFKPHHWGWYTAEEYLAAIDQVLLSTLKNELQTASFISISIDESTDRSTQSKMSIHIYYVKALERHHAFVALPVIPRRPSAEHLLDVLLSALKNKLEMQTAQLANRLVAFAADGAAVLQGKHSGVITRIKERCPFVLRMHCMAHRLDLAAENMKQSDIICSLGRMCSLVQNTFSHASRLSELFAAQAQLKCSHPLKMLKHVDTRWISHFKPCTRLWQLLLGSQVTLDESELRRNVTVTLFLSYVTA
jgi:hypothetical protein